MKYSVRDESQRNIKNMFTKTPRSDIPCYRVMRDDDQMVMETHITYADAAERAAELNARDKNFSLDELMREYAEND